MGRDVSFSIAFRSPLFILTILTSSASSLLPTPSESLDTGRDGFSPGRSKFAAAPSSRLVDLQQPVGTAEAVP